MIYEYTGEYGTEFTTFIPYIYYLKANNLFDGKVLTYAGMRCYYFFLQDNEIDYKPDQRIFVPSHDRVFVPQHIRHDDDYIISLTNPPEYLPPPYHIFFKTIPLDITNKPIVLIFNKYNSEWGGSSPPCNYFDLHELSMLAYVFQEYDIFYFRSSNTVRSDYANDHDEKNGTIYDYADKEFLRKNYPYITIFEDLLNMNPGIDYNTAKGVLLSRAALSISTLTGTTHFAYYFDTKHILYRKMAPHPFKTPTYYRNLHKLLSRTDKNTNISYVTSQEELLTACHQQGLPTQKFPVYDS